jgi:hypothetical protein
MPAWQWSSGPQSALLMHAPKHDPFMQTLPEAAQSVLWTHCPPAAGLVSQKPEKHLSPEPQSASVVQAASQDPLRHWPLGPHWVLN